MRNLGFLIAAFAFVLVGCGSPPAPAARKVSVAFVRIVNLTDRPFQLTSKERMLSGLVKPGSYSAFNFVSLKSTTVALKDASGKALPLPGMPPAGEGVTYVVRNSGVTTLQGENRLAPRDNMASVSFRALDGTTKSATLVAADGTKTEVNITDATKLAAGKYTVQIAGAKASEANLLVHGTYTILLVDDKQPPMIMLDSPNPKPAAAGSASA